MDWYNLKKNKRPKCGKDLDPTDQGGIVFCSKYKVCGFFISAKKLSSIVVSMVEKNIDQDHETEEG